jgi:hypothetical protein
MKKIILTLWFAFIITIAFAQKITEKKGKFGMEVDGRTVLKTKYEAVKKVEMFYKSTEEDALVAVKQNGKWGFFNLKGKEVIPMKYEDCQFSFYSRVAGVKSNGKWGFIDNKGVEKIPFQYDDAKNFSQVGSDNYGAVKMNDKWGFINEKGKEVISFKYDDVISFPRGFASTSVKLDGKWGYIDEKGKMYIDAEYDEAFSFIGDKARVKKDGRVFYITYSGREVESSTTNYNSNSGNNSNNNNSSKTNTPKKATNYKCGRCGTSGVSNDGFSPKGYGTCKEPNGRGGYKVSTTHQWKKS